MNTPAEDHREHTVSDAEGHAADVPAGGAGADSGAVSATEIDADDDARLQNVSSQNDIAGVGTRAADGNMERGTDDERASTSRHHEHESEPQPEGQTNIGGEAHVEGDSAIAHYQPGVGRDSAASSKIAQSLPDPDDD